MRRKLFLGIIDISVIVTLYYAIYTLINFGVGSMQVQGSFTIGKLLLLICCIIVTRIAFKIYSSIWRYASVKTYIKLIISDTIGSLIFLSLGRYAVTELYLGFSCSLILMFAIMLFTLCTRFIYQMLYAKHSISGDSRVSANKEAKVNVAIVGAGNVGASLAEELIRNPKSHYIPYCFIDKDVHKVGQGINGLKIYPEDDKIVELIKELPVSEIVIALPDASADDKLRLYNLYKQTDCKVKVYEYPLYERDNASHGKRTLRELKIEDLLFRDIISVNNTLTKKFYEGKTVMVTGGGGSIGSELCRQIAKLGPEKLIIIDIYENNAYDIQQELIRKYQSKLNLEVDIASVRDVKRLEEIFRRNSVDVVFHAAAHKHVPLMENSACEAIKNNVIGTYNMANLSEKYGVQKFLLISTDKAVNPTNVMGASKRLCEMVIQCRSDRADNPECVTQFTAVRFGNVLGSNGSVIPLFRKQIEAGGPLTITDKRIVRYFMTIPEAVGLVMETCAMAQDGELFVLDMGKPVKILELAENMIRLSGLRPYEDIDIVEIGLRPGEKLYEELLMKSEELDSTDNKMIFIERDRGCTRAEMELKLDILLRAVEAEGYESVVKAIKETVPTYHDPEDVNCRAVFAEEMMQADKTAGEKQTKEQWNHAIEY